METTRTRIKLINLEPQNYSPKAGEILRSFAQVDEFSAMDSDIAEVLSLYDGAIVRLGYRLDASALRYGETLRVLATPTTGLDHIDEEEAGKKGIKVISLRGETAFLDTIRATAEHTMALMLSLIRRVPWSFSSVLSGKWDRDPYRGSELYGKTLGILGLGRLGKHVAEYARTFGMRVIAHDGRSPVSSPHIEGVSFEFLFRQSDLVSIHIPLNSETKGLVGKRELAWMRPGSVLVNTSRGAVLDENALLEALNEKRLAGAALDVLCQEPSSAGKWGATPSLIHYARTHENLLITPHIGGATHESMERTEIFIAEKIKDYFQKSGR